MRTEEHSLFVPARLKSYQMASPLKATVRDRTNAVQSLHSCSYQNIARWKDAFSSRSVRSLCIAVMKTLMTATLTAMVTASVAVVVPDDVICQKGKNDFGIAFNGSSHYFSIRLVGRYLVDQCKVTVTSTSGTKLPQPRLVKLGGLNPEMDETACYSSLVALQLQVEDKVTRFCQFTLSNELLLWINMPFTLEHVFKMWFNLDHYWISLSEEAEAINVCTLGKEASPLQVDHKIYVFATNPRFKNIPPNNATCTLQEYSMTVEAGSQSKVWIVTVLAAPPAISCWTLLLNGRRYSIGDTLITNAGSSITLHYGNCSFHDCQRMCINLEGFTLRMEVAED